MGVEVRWGGEIVAVDNREEATLVEVVSRELSDRGRPRAQDRSQGRFRARISGFLDPAVYDTGRQITVVGPVSGLEEGKVGDYPYRFPIVAVDTYYLWPPPSEPRHYDPFYYDPFWHPYPWYHYPYY